MSTPSFSYQHYQCDRDWVHKHPSDNQCRGITTWNLEDTYKIPPLAPGQSIALTFTCTVPKCYSNHNVRDSHPIQGRDNCNIVFNAYAKDNNTPDGIDLDYTLNSKAIGGCRISGVAGNGGTQTFDIGQPDLHDKYDDMTKNTFTITNKSNNSTVQIDHFKIYRVYQMCNIVGVEHDSLCIAPNPNVPTPCEPGFTAGTTGNLDSSRNDKPCNYASGGGLSFSQHHNEAHKGSTIAPGGSCQWTFNFNANYASNGYTGNYAGESICLFNFNQTQTVGTATTPDVPVAALLNGHTINTYYLSKNPVNYKGEETGMFLSHDLVTSQYYDALGSNTVTLKNVSGATIRMIEAIDVYRIFETDNLLYTSPCDYVCQLNQGGCPSCNTSCQIVCVTCDACNAGCNIGCNTGCEVSCQNCQTGCEVSCQGCNIGCNTGCQVSCQTGCQVSCQDCYDCQVGCQVDCQDGCELNCQGCYSCAGGCYSSCQFFCVTCDACYSFCQNCNTCQNCDGCQTGCQANCQTGCQISCQNCNTCQTVCESCASCYQDCYDVCYEYTNYNPQTTNNNQTTTTQQTPTQPNNKNNKNTKANNSRQQTTPTTTTTNTTTTANNNQLPTQQNPNKPQNPNRTRNTQQTPDRPQNPNSPNNINQNPNFTATQTNNDEHIKEILLESLIELDLIKQPQKRRQMTNDPK